MNNPFFNADALSSSEILKLVESYQFEEPIYHSDGYGHVQVEQPLQKINYSFNDLILLIEERQLWPEVIKKLRDKDDFWLINFSTEIETQCTEGAFNCLFQLSLLIKDEKNQVFQYQGAAKWPWKFGSISLLKEMECEVLILKKQLVKQEPDTAEIYLSIVNDTLTNIQLLKETL